MLRDKDEAEEREGVLMMLLPVVNFEGLSPAKPLSKRQREKLGDELERADIAVAQMWADDKGTFSFSSDSVSFEEFERIMKRRHDAEIAFIDAVNAHSLYVRAKAWRSKRTHNHEQAFTLRNKMYLATFRAEEFEDLYPEFVASRELIEAKAARTLAEQLFYIGQKHYQRAERQAKADRAAGINRY